MEIKLINDNNTDTQFFDLNDEKYSCFVTSEHEVLVCDGLKVKVSDITQNDSKGFKYTNIVLEQIPDD